MFLGFGIEVSGVGGGGFVDRFFSIYKYLCLTNMNKIVFRALSMRINDP